MTKERLEDKVRQLEERLRRVEATLEEVVSYLEDKDCLEKWHLRREG